MVAKAKESSVQSKEILLTHIKARDSKCVDDEGDEGTFNGKKPEEYDGNASSL